MSFRTILIIVAVTLFGAFIVGFLMVRYGFVPIWNAFGSNLVAEVVGILMVVFLVDRLLQKREREKWMPAREIIIRSLAKAYSSLFNATSHSINPDTMSAPTGPVINSDVYRIRLGLLQQAQCDFERAQITIDLYSPALDAPMLSKISMLLDAAEELQRKLWFFIQFYNPERQMYDLILEPPFAEIDRIQEIIEQLKQEHEKVFNDPARRVVNPSLVSAEDLKAVWKTFEETQDRICFDLGGYEYKEGRVPMVLDMDALRRLSIRGIADGQPIQVFESYH